MNYKVEGNIIYPDMRMLTWGGFYYRSMDEAVKKAEEILKDITKWCNEKDPSLKIEPKNVKRLDKRIIFDIQAWKDNDNLENCDGIITVEEIYFEDCYKENLEVKEVDLEKYYYEFLQKEWFGNPHVRTISEMMSFTAKHFFELGLKVQKGKEI